MKYGPFFLTIEAQTTDDDDDDIYILYSTKIINLIAWYDNKILIINLLCYVILYYC